MTDDSGARWTTPRQLRLRGPLGSQACLQLETLDADAPVSCIVELRDRDGQRFFCAGARLVELRRDEGAKHPTLGIQTDVTLVVHAGDETAQAEQPSTATLAEIIRLAGQRAESPRRMTRAELEKRDEQMRGLRRGGWTVQMLQAAFGLSQRRVQEIVQGVDGNLEVPATAPVEE